VRDLVGIEGGDQRQLPLADRQHDGEHPTERVVQGRVAVGDARAAQVRRRQRAHDEHPAGPQPRGGLGEELDGVEPVQHGGGGIGHVDDDQVVRVVAGLDEQAPVGVQHANARVGQGRAGAGRQVRRGGREQRGIELHVVDALDAVADDLPQRSPQSTAHEQHLPGVTVLRHRQVRQGHRRLLLEADRTFVRATGREHEVTALVDGDLVVAGEHRDRAVARAVRVEQLVPRRLQPPLEPRRAAVEQRRQRHQRQADGGDRDARDGPAPSEHGGEHGRADGQGGLDGVEVVHQDQRERQPAQRVAGRLADVGLGGACGAGRFAGRIACAPDARQQHELSAQQRRERRRQRQAGDDHVEQRQQRAGRRVEGRRQGPDEQHGRGQQQRDERRVDPQESLGVGPAAQRGRAEAAADAHPQHPRGQDDAQRQLVAVEHHQQLAQDDHLPDLAGDAQHEHHRQVRRKAPGEGAPHAAPHLRL
jgi:hypothetical protein